MANPGPRVSKSVILLTNIPNHYRIPLFNELLRVLEQHNLSLAVLFAAASYERRRAGGREFSLKEAKFRWQILRSLEIGKIQPIFIPLGLGRNIKRLNPAALIGLGTGSLGVLAYIAAKKLRLPFIIWTGEISRGSRWVARLKRPVKRWLLRHSDAVIAYGSASSEFVQTLAPDVPIFHGWNTGDLSPFLAIDRQKIQPRPQVLRLVSVGDLVELKGYRYLLEALASVESQVEQPFELTVVGDGPSGDDLKLLTEQLNMSDRVQWLGRKPASEIPSILSRADIFVFPSLGDVWGLALLEGMAAGLPVIASSSAGATSDLVLPGTGIVVDPVDVAGFGAALHSIMKLSYAQRQEMGERAREHVAALCSLQNSAAGFAAAVRHAVAARG